jgi:hypothetical protein
MGDPESFNNAHTYRLEKKFKISKTLRLGM